MPVVSTNSWHGIIEPFRKQLSATVLSQTAPMMTSQIGQGTVMEKDQILVLCRTNPEAGLTQPNAWIEIIAVLIKQVETLKRVIDLPPLKLQATGPRSKTSSRPGCGLLNKVSFPEGATKLSL